MYSKIRNKYFIVLTCLSVIVLMSCGKSFLEKEPIGKISKEQLFTDINGARAALNGAYNRMAYYYIREFGAYGDIAGDQVQDTVLSGSSLPLMYKEYTYSSSVGDDELAPGHIWTYTLVAMDQVNNVLEALPSLQDKFPGAKVEIDQMTGQALILRAFCHFDLSKVYAQTYQFAADASHLGIPVLLKTPAPGSLVARKPLKEVYEQIITDLKTGERLLKNNPMARDQFLVSYQAAWGLLSRVYLYMGQWDQSIAYADSVINKGGFTLTASGDYLNMYTSGTPASEVIWQLYNRAAKPLLAATLFSYEVAPNKKLLALFDAGDIRRDAMRDSVTKDLAGTITGVRRVTQKFGATGKPATQIVMDAKVIRLSEIYLNRAEAKWNKNDYSGATADVRVIAERAHNGSAIAIPADPSSLFDFICDERSRELCFEGHRLFDIARRKQDIKRGPGCDAPVCTLTYPNVRFVLPIPQIELDANKAMQRNPGIN